MAYKETAASDGEKNQVKHLEKLRPVEWQNTLGYG